MTDPQTSARFGLPFLSVGQAQKEITHNEALTLIDALVHSSCEAGPQVTPLTTALAGQSWIIGSGATGDWTGKDKAIALWSDGGWRFMSPRPEMRCVRISDGKILRFDGVDWFVPSVLPPPTGGTTIDSACRDAINALISALAEQGLVIPG